ncbi:NPP1 domain-containing protein [Colletotrichum nymphaeae SA-01]|uniref:NPP1 domain-containing protein n=1 Tax=Colletotrichum nymphaeae SA-01 TaxID=1460502 RepID=A0A135TV87_9PEZI|nr:NPP1 domain-containing protein [Colletotrichum nymphaeae SA-01]
MRGSLLPRGGDNANEHNLIDRTMISCVSLPVLAKDAVTNVQYEKTQIPFNDADSQAQMNAAYQEGSLRVLRGGGLRPVT